MLSRRAWSLGWEARFTVASSRAEVDLRSYVTPIFPSRCRSRGDWQIRHFALECELVSYRGTNTHLGVQVRAGGDGRTCFGREAGDFLAGRDGGSLDNSAINAPGVGTLGVRRFFSTRPDGGTSLLGQLEIYGDRVEDGFLPIADDNLGNLFLLSLRGDDLGAITFWDHEHEAEEGHPPGTDNTTLVAPTFTQFLASVEPGPDLPADPDAVVWADPDFRPRFD